MSFRLRLRPEAEADIAGGYRWYRARAARLASDFLDELGRALSAVSDHPGAHPSLHKKVRRALVRRFPYAIFYIVEGDEVVVLGIFHQARDPRRWRRRINS